MSARVGGTSPNPAVAAPAVVLAGAAILLARPFVDAAPGGRTALFATAYLVIGVAAVSLPGRTAIAPVLPWAPALALGVLAVAVVGTLGPPVPVPWGPAALPLAGLAGVAEEALFRRAAYGWLERFGAPVAVVGSAALFAAVHIPAYGLTVLPVDLGAGLLLSWQRWASGSWTAPAATHVVANALAVLR